MQKLLANYLLGISIVSAAILRIVVPWEVVFKEGQTIFTEVDSYYFLRLADTIIKHWQGNIIDPYIMDMSVLQNNIAFSTLLSLVSFGKTEWLDIVTAFFPAICGVLIVIIIYFLAKKLFGLWTGIASAIMVSTVQGYMLARTSLGYADQHCLEILLSMGVLCCIVYALRKSIYFAIIGGLLLGAYIMIWHGSPLLLLMLCIYMVVQSIINHTTRSTDTYFYFVMFTVNFVALCVFIFTPMMEETNYLIVLLISTITPLGLYLVSKAIYKLPTIIYPICLVVTVTINIVGLYFLFPYAFEAIHEGLRSLTSGGTGAVSETQTLTFQNMWNNLGMISIFGLMGLVLMALKEDCKDGSITLLIVVSIGMLLVSYSMRRFMYYTEPLMAIACAYLIIKLVAGMVRNKREEIKVVSITCAVIFCCLFIIVPNTMAAIKQNSIAGFAPAGAWREACNWIRYNTEEPFDNGNYYYAIYKDGDIKQGYRVLAWWEKGYWILRMAHRPVVSTPGGGNIQLTSDIFMNENVDNAMELIRQAKIRYVIMDYAMTGIEWSQVGGNAIAEKTFAGQIWNNDNTKYWNKVWQSKEMYGNIAQVKVYKMRYDNGKSK